MSRSEFQEDEPQRPRRPPPRRGEDDEYDDDLPPRRDVRRHGDPVAGLIPYTNPKALIAYYLGVFGLIPCLGLALGPAALILGILGVRYARANPTARGTGHAIAGIVLGSLEVLGNYGVVIAGVVAALMKK